MTDKEVGTFRKFVRTSNEIFLFVQFLITAISFFLVVILIIVVNSKINGAVESINNIPNEVLAGIKNVSSKIALPSIPKV